MAVAEEIKQALRGGEFMIKESKAEDTFIPEEFSEEQLMFASMAREFVDKHVLPNIIDLDKQKEGLGVSLMEQAGELGLLGASVPEQYGGMGVNINTESILTEILGGAHSFSVSFAAHTGIGTLPILYFGTEEQKQKYLPGLATAELKAAYCLTEPGSGSDALAARTKATLTEDGEHYIIEGQKMWITNAGFADVFTVFAKIDGEKFTGFIVEKGAENLRFGEEEDKLGIKGSSTRQVFFEGVKVPKENILGEIGKGHKIAFNVLNIGRYKLSVATVGGAKAAASLAIKYANEREQFGRPIAKFGAIKHKLAEMAVRIFAAESANYRTSAMMKQKIANLVADGKNPVESKLIAAEEYAIECAMLKVIGSEALDYVVDETVQIHGGNGFSEEYNAARCYRDSRINRIFEGTNEINRLLTIDMLLKRAMAGKIDLMPHAMAVQKELMSVPSFGSNGESGLFAIEKKAIANAKKAALMVAGAAAQKFMAKLAKEQEIIMFAADMLNDIFAAESNFLRVEKLIGIRGEEASQDQIDLAQIFLSDAMERIYTNGKRAIAAFAEGDELTMMGMGLKRFTKMKPYNTVAARRRVAAKLIEANSYCF